MVKIIKSNNNVNILLMLMNYKYDSIEMIKLKEIHKFYKI